MYYLSRLFMDDSSFGWWAKSTLPSTIFLRTPKRFDSRSASWTSLALRTSTKTGLQQFSGHHSSVAAVFTHKFIHLSSCNVVFVAALSSSASTLPTSSCSSSLSDMFSSWSRTSTPVKTLSGQKLTTKTTRAPWMSSPTNL